MTLLFTRSLAEKVAAGEKTVTRRPLSDNPRSPWWEGGCRWAPGDVLAVLGGFDRPAVCRVAVLTVEQMPLGRLDDVEARLEGFASAAEFEAVIAAKYGTYDPMVEVWRMAFERRSG